MGSARDKRLPTLGLTLAHILVGCTLQDFDRLSSGLNSSPDAGFDSIFDKSYELGSGPDAGVVKSDNLLDNPDFEQGSLGWYSFDSASVNADNTDPHGGNLALRCADRRNSDAGVGVRIRHLVNAGSSYTISGWFKIHNTMGATQESVVNAYLQYTCFLAGDVDRRTPAFLGDQAGVDGSWRQFSFELERSIWATLDCDLSNMHDLKVLFDGPPADVELFLDDMSLSLNESQGAP